MKPNYQRFDLDLATVRTAAEVIGVGTQFDGVTVIQLPGGAVVSISFGGNGAFIPLLIQGQSFAFKDVCDNPFPANEGLFIQNPAGAGTLILLVTSPNPVP